MKKAKYFLKSKTVQAGIGTILVGLGMFFTGEQEAEEVVITVVGVAFTILRFITNQPVKLK